MAIAPAPDPAKLRGLVGIGLEKAQAALRGGGPAGFAALGFGLTTRIKVLLSHFLLQAQCWTESVARDGARILR
jgi:hypothetical protein